MNNSDPPFCLQRYFCFPAWSGTSSPVFLPALLLRAGLVYPNSLQFVNLPARGQPHLQQPSLGKGSAEPLPRIPFLVLTSREPGRAGAAERGSGSIGTSRAGQGESAGAEPRSQSSGGFVRMLQPQQLSTASQALPDLPNPAGNLLDHWPRLVVSFCV